MRILSLPTTCWSISILLFSLLYINLDFNQKSFMRQFTWTNTLKCVHWKLCTTHPRWRPRFPFPANLGRPFFKIQIVNGCWVSNKQLKRMMYRRWDLFILEK
ncbi:hypothetical protein O6H91_10G021700 [Diphasiastrum complanatum]|uniref:Uncharacterized protein n=1 Tax=Diphasiastrum complanatum TaxID=34168 RepID=A0ACC2CEY9_DIPCM|nr:hypothetical protein O6H91_10G021700 [Diphasiastrum complanatum]